MTSTNNHVVISTTKHEQGKIVTPEKLPEFRTTLQDYCAVCGAYLVKKTDLELGVCGNCESKIEKQINLLDA